MNTYAPMYDAAYPANLSGVSGAIGGYLHGPNALNPWTGTQWGGFRTNRKLPIWEAGFNGEDEGFACFQELYRLGVPAGVPVALAMETRADVSYVTRFGAVLHRTGYLVWVTGSRDTVFANPELDGYWVEDLTGTRHMDPHPGTKATQWDDAGNYDVSELDLTALGQLWL